MDQVISKALGYIGIIIIAYFLKTKHLIPQTASSIFSALMLNFTLPCAIVMNMNGTSVTLSCLWVIAIGILYNIISLVIGYLSSSQKNQKIMKMINVSGYNIGCFAMPFIGGFLTPEALLVTSMFDIGNSLMCLGFNYGIASALQSSYQHFDFRQLLSKVIHSFPIWTYIIMFILAFLSVPVPNSLLPFFETVGKANPFIAMLVIGFSLQIKFQSDYLKEIYQVVSLRLVISLCLALLTAFLPFTFIVRKTILILCFAPIGAAAIVFTELLNLDSQKAACVNSIYVVVSILAMTLCLMFI